MKCSRRCRSDTKRYACTSRDVCMSDDNTIVIINGAHPRPAMYTEKRRQDVTAKTGTKRFMTRLTGHLVNYVNGKQFFNQSSHEITPDILSDINSRLRTL